MNIGDFLVLAFLALLLSTCVGIQVEEAQRSYERSYDALRLLAE